MDESSLAKEVFDLVEGDEDCRNDSVDCCTCMEFDRLVVAFDTGCLKNLGVLTLKQQKKNKEPIHVHTDSTVRVKIKNCA